MRTKLRNMNRDRLLATALIALLFLGALERIFSINTFSLVWEVLAALVLAGVSLLVAHSVVRSLCARGPQMSVLVTSDDQVHVDFAGPTGTRVSTHQELTEDGWRTTVDVNGGTLQ